MKHDGKHWVFSSGRQRYAFTDRLSISQYNGEWQVSYGSDGGLWDAYSEEYQEQKLSTDDLLELARHQIERWQAFERWLADQT